MEKKELAKIVINSKTVAERLEEIWLKKPDKIVYKPYAPKFLIENSVLFVGINPSVTKGRSQIGNTFQDPWEMNFNVAFKDSCKEPHRHYKKFFDLRDGIIEMGFNPLFSYMDILYIQHSNQRDLYEYKDQEFIKDQVTLSIDIIKVIKPKLVVVCNSFAATLFHSFGNSVNFSLESEKRVYKLNEIPFIIEESRYMGSRQHWLGNLEKKKTLFKEIKRVLLSDSL